MTITLTKEELEKFEDTLAKWWVLAFDYVLQNTKYDMARNMYDFKPTFERFKKEHPKPDWRSLL